MSVVAFCDGSSLKGGGAGAGVVIHDYRLRSEDSPTDTIFRYSLPIGKGTNNEAEYQAIVFAIQKIDSMPSIGFDEEIVIFTDSELAVKQISGEYQVKNKNLKAIYSQIVKLIAKYTNLKVKHLPREDNEQADALSRIASLISMAQSS